MNFLTFRAINKNCNNNRITKGLLRNTHQQWIGVDAMTSNTIVDMRTITFSKQVKRSASWWRSWQRENSFEMRDILSAQTQSRFSNPFSFLSSCECSSRGDKTRQFCEHKKLLKTDVGGFRACKRVASSRKRSFTPTILMCVFCADSREKCASFFTVVALKNSHFLDKNP